MEAECSRSALALYGFSVCHGGKERLTPGDGHRIWSMCVVCDGESSALRQFCSLMADPLLS